MVTGALLVPVSCLKDMPKNEEDFPRVLQWNPDLAFPLGKESFGMNAESGFDTTLWDLDPVSGFPKWVNQVEVEMSGRVLLDLSSASQDVEDIHEILLRLNMSNGFPHEMLTQAYFIDENENRLDSMFSMGPILVNPGGIPGNGEVIDPATLRTDVTLSHERILVIWDAKEILLRAVISDIKPEELDTATIDFYHNYHFDLDIGMMVSLSLEL